MNEKRWFLFTYIYESNDDLIPRIGRAIEDGENIQDAFEKFRRHTIETGILAITDLTGLNDPFAVFDKEYDGVE